MEVYLNWYTNIYYCKELVILTPKDGKLLKNQGLSHMAYIHNDARDPKQKMCVLWAAEMWRCHWLKSVVKNFLVTSLLPNGLLLQLPVVCIDDGDLPFIFRDAGKLEENAMQIGNGKDSPCLPHRAELKKKTTAKNIQIVFKFFPPEVRIK